MVLADSDFTPAAFDTGMPVNLIAAASLLEEAARAQPEVLGALRERLAAGGVELCGGPYEEREDALLPLESGTLTAAGPSSSGVLSISTGGLFQLAYSVCKGVDKIVPVDIYVPGCPPRPEALTEGFMRIQDKMMRERWANKLTSASRAV